MDFPNGLKVLLVEDHTAPVFNYATWYNVGSSDEVLGKTGIAHLFEHMMFKETEDLAEGEFDKLIEEAGSPDLNAWTWLDQTV